tara:strand:+ start:920 stop:1348 length:429 start_codon:yes stop_codon:yes gene_type:complete
MNNLTRYNNSTPSLLGRSVFDSLFDPFFSDPTSWVRRSTEGYPLTDLYRDEDGNQVIELALAGFTKDQLAVEVKDNTITIRAEQGGTEENERRIARRSFSKGFRDVTGTLDFAAAGAKFENGLLRITVPPVTEVSPTMITIR